MSDEPIGRVLLGNEEEVRHSIGGWKAQPVDQEWLGEPSRTPPGLTTIAKPVSVAGPGTFFRGATRTLTFEPSEAPGWWFKRDDLPDSLPIGVSVGNVWTTARNIVLRSGSPHNYMRMVEHIIALRVGMGLDNVRIRLTSGDPPLFDRSSMDLVETIDRAGIVVGPTPAPVVTVREPVTVGGPHGSFLTFLPAEGSSRELVVDCAIDFRSAIGRQRIRFVVTPNTFRHGAFARTNTTLGMLVYCRTIGILFADLRNLGYNTRNILVAGRFRYFNKPRLIHQGKSLEAAWHRAVMDLLAAVALIDRGRFAGRIISYKSGHDLDVRMIRALYQHDLLVPLPS